MELVDFQVWGRLRQRDYERQRALWRAQHPLIDVGALERLHGITRESITIEQLKKSAPPIIIGAGG